MSFLRTILTVLFILLFGKSQLNTETMHILKIFRGKLIKKPYTDRRGIQRERQDYYLRNSEGEYFIKICEGKISRAQLDDLY